MIKLYCDMCGEGTNRLNSINTKVEYQGEVIIGVDIDKLFEDINKDCITRKMICDKCKSLLLLNALNYFQTYDKEQGNLLNKKFEEESKENIADSREKT